MEPTQETNEETTDNSGDMQTAYTEIAKEVKESEPTKGPDDDKIDLTKPEGEFDHKEWVAQKEKGIEKVVNRAKESEEKANELQAQAKMYLDNKDGIDTLTDWWTRVNTPETRDKAMEELNAHVNPFVPELEDDKKLMDHMNSNVQARFDDLKRQLDAATKPLAEQEAKREADITLGKRIEDTYESTATEISSACNGYKVGKDKHSEAIRANPTLSEFDAVRKHCFNEIMGHTSELSRTGKKKEIVDSSTAKESGSPESGDLLENLKYLRSKGSLDE